MEKLLSICIPTYNRVDKLKKSIEALICITDKMQNDAIEIIVSDNNSSDNTFNLVGSHLDKLTYYRQEKNLGYDGNVKFLFSVAKGKFIFFVADDDKLIDDKFRELYHIIEDNQDVDCFVVNFFQEYNKKDDKYSFIEKSKTIVQLKELGKYFHRPFIFLSGFILKNKKVNLENILNGTYFTQMDIALLTLDINSKLYIYRDFVVWRIVPSYEDETGCNILDDAWKIYLGSSKVQRKYASKFGVRLPYLLEVYQVLAFSGNYFRIPNRNLCQSTKNICKAMNALEWKYKIRLIFIPFIIILKLIKKLFRFLSI